MFDWLRGERPPRISWPKQWPVVALYHGVYPTIDVADRFQSFNVSQQRLAAQLERLSRAYRILDEDEFLEIARGGWRNAHGTCLITIDDGYRCLCRPEVTEIFASFGVRPLLFLLAGAMDGQLRPYHSTLVSILRRARGRITLANRPWDLSDSVDRRLLSEHVAQAFVRRPAEEATALLNSLVELTGVDPEPVEPDLEFMTWEEAKQLHAQGWGIGSHAWSHHPLARLKPEEAAAELERSRALIEERLEIRVRSCSYPNGSQSAAVREAAARHYDLGFAVHSNNPTHPFEIPRVDLGGMPFHDFLRFRQLHPAVETVHGGRARAGEGGSRLQQKLEWLTRYAVAANGTLGARQLVLHRGLPETVEIKSQGSSYTRREGRPRVAILTRTNPSHRYAVSRMARELDLVGVVIERNPGDPVIIAECADGYTEREALCLRPEDRPWFPQDHPRGGLMELTFGSSWEAYSVEPGTPTLVLNQGENINAPRVVEALDAWKPDFLFVFGTSLVKDEICRRALRCAVNMHNGLSPEYRGSFTLWWPLFHGRPEYVGGTLHLVTPKIDGGEIFIQWRPEIDGSEMPEELEILTQQAGLELAIRLFQRLHAGEEIRPVGQEPGAGSLYMAAEFSELFREAVYARVRTGLLAEYARDRESRDRQVPLLISPDW